MVGFDSKQLALCTADVGRLITGELQLIWWLDDGLSCTYVVDFFLDTVKNCKTAGRTKTQILYVLFSAKFFTVCTFLFLLFSDFCIDFPFLMVTSSLKHLCFLEFWQKFQNCKGFLNDATVVLDNFSIVGIDWYISMFNVLFDNKMGSMHKGFPLRKITFL